MLHDSGNVVFLEEADGGNAGSSGFEARTGIGEGDAAESEDWDFHLAGLVEHREARGLRGGAVFFLEHGSEYGEGCAVGGGLSCFRWGVTGDGNDWMSWRGLAGMNAPPT
jgi:hypothetical protein